MPTTHTSEQLAGSVWARLRLGLHHMRGLDLRIAPKLDLFVLAATLLVLMLSFGANHMAVAAAALVLAGLVVVRQLVTVRQVREIDRARRKSEARFGWLVMNSSDLIMAVDASGAIDYVSPSVERLLRAGDGKLLGARLTELAHPEDGCAVDALLDRAMRSPGERISAEWRLRQGDGTWLPVETVATSGVLDGAKRSPKGSRSTSRRRCSDRWAVSSGRATTSRSRWKPEPGPG